MSTLNVDKVDPSSGTALELGTSGDTITVPTGAGLTVTDEVKTNKISPATGTAFALGDSGDTFTIPSGATITNSGTATGFGGGKIVQMTNAAFISNTIVTSTSPTATHCVGTITPTSSSNKILVIYNGAVEAYEGSGTNAGARLKVYRDIGGAGYADSIQAGEINCQVTGASAEMEIVTVSTIIFQDSPATTSAVSYKLYAQTYATDLVDIGYLDQMTSMILLETDES